MERAEQRSVEIVVRGLTPKDLDAVVAIDSKSTGRRREEYFRIKLQQNLAGLGVPTLRTEVAWEDTQLLAFFQRERFRPAARLCLELPVTHRP